MSKPTDLVQGTLDLLLLKILALEPLHGWAISLRLKSISGDVLQVTEGSLYPALHKLENEEMVESYDAIENGRPRRYYRITGKGRRMLAKDREEWRRMSRAVTLIPGKA